MKRLLTLTIAALALAFAASAVAGITIYKNGFKTKREAKEIGKLQGGKPCKKAGPGNRTLQTKVTKGNRNCLFSTPVEGDSERPNHVVQVIGQVQRKTRKRIRKRVYLGAAVRVSRRSGYELRIFPKGRRYRLLRNGERVAGGQSKDIDRINKRNVVRISAVGRKVLAKVNGKRLTVFRDDAPEEVNGRKTALGFGSVAKSNKNGFGRFVKVKVVVPNP